MAALLTLSLPVSAAKRVEWATTKHTLPPITLAHGGAFVITDRLEYGLVRVVH